MRPPLPPFTAASARAKIQAPESLRDFVRANEASFTGNQAVSLGL